MNFNQRTYNKLHQPTAKLLLPAAIEIIAPPTAYSIYNPQHVSLGTQSLLLDHSLSAINSYSVVIYVCHNGISSIFEATHLVKQKVPYFHIRQRKHHNHVGGIAEHTIQRQVSSFCSSSIPSREWQLSSRNDSSVSICMYYQKAPEPITIQLTFLYQESG